MVVSGGIPVVGDVGQHSWFGSVGVGAATLS